MSAPDAVLARRRDRAAAVRRGDLAERAVRQALDLACLVRDEDADGIGRWLAGQRLDDEQARALLIALAAMVPVGAMSGRDMLSWLAWDEHGQPLEPARPACGTPEAWRAHKKNDELTDDACREAMRRYWAVRNARRAAGKPAAREKRDAA